MIRSSIVASLMLVVVLGVEASSADDPPLAKLAGGSAYNPALFRGSSARLGDLGDLKIPERGELLWRFDFNKDLGNPVVSDGIVYVTDRDGTLYAFKADGSAIAWQDDRPGRQVYAAPTVSGDRIYLATGEGLSALAKANGKTLWDSPSEGNMAGSSPLVVGDKIIVGDSAGFIRAVNAADGKLAWKLDIVADAPPPPPGFDMKQAGGNSEAASPRTMSTDGSTVFVPIFDQSRIVAIDVATGKRVWSFQSKGWMYGEPAVAGDDVFATSQDKSLYCLDKANGKPRWSFKTGWRVESGVAVRDGSAYFGSCDGLFYKVDVKTGKSAWKFRTDPDGNGNARPIYSSPIVSGDSVCFGSFDGFVYAINTADGSLKWKVQPVEGGEVNCSPVSDSKMIFATVRYDQFKKAGANALFAIGEAKPK